MSNSLRIIFAGTPDFAAQHLEALVNAKHQIVGIFTQLDRPAGRGNRLTPSPVKRLAELYNLPIFQPSSLRKFEEHKRIAALKADIMVIVAYGLILPKTVIDLLRLGCINVHGSLLPRWRGAAPIQRALWAGDKQTGITIIQMDTGIDTGAILHKVTYDIKPEDTSASLCDKLAKIGSNALLTTIDRLANGHIAAEPQDNTLATYADKLSKDEARLDWFLPAVQLERYIRAFNPWPISYFSLSGRLIKVWASSVDVQQKTICVPGTILDVDKSGIYIATGNGILRLTQLQLAGKKAMSVQDLINSHHEWFIPGTLLN